LAENELNGIEFIKQLTRFAGFAKRSACTENHLVQQAAFVLGGRSLCALLSRGY
jgi:hypothetical protein